MPILGDFSGGQGEIHCNPLLGILLNYFSKVTIKTTIKTKN